MLATLNRTTTPDPTGFDYKLFPAQTRAFNLDTKHKAFIGGIGSGKTFLGALWAVTMTLTREGNGMILAPTYSMLGDVSLVEYLAILDRHYIDYEHNIGRGQIQTGNGTVFLRSAEKPDRLRGPNLTWAWGDEAGLWREDAFKVLLGRLRLGNAESMLTTTPSGFNWLWSYFEDTNDPRHNPERYSYARGSSRENRHLDSEFVNDLMVAYSAEYAAQEIDGQFVAFEGMIYSEFDRQVHIKEKEIPEGWRRFRAIDYGYTNPFVCLWGAVDEDGRLYIYHEYYIRRRLIKEHAVAILGYEDAGYQATCADWDAQDNAEMTAARVPTSRAQKDVTVGIQKVKARLDIQADGQPRLYIHPSCVNLIKEIGIYRWQPNRVAGGNAKEAPMKEADHAMDALRYMVMEIDHGGFFIL